MSISWTGWHAVCALLCAYFQLNMVQARRPDLSYRIDRDMETIETRHAFKEMTDDESSPGMGFPKRLIPIKEPRVDRNFVMNRMPLDPDAEMLPAHYTGVKPPGVDHMELRSAETQISNGGSKVAAPKTDPNLQEGGEEAVGKKQVSLYVDGDEMYEKAASFESEQRGSHLKSKGKGQYVETGSKGTARGDREKSSGHRIAQAEGNRGANYKKNNNNHVNSKAVGYRNVYHKNEYNKDHDFYENDDEGGHLKKHGHYNEKHVASEGKFKKGASRDSGFNEEEHRKQGVSGNSQASEESKGHEARRGHDEFLTNFHGFGKQTNEDEGKGFGFDHTERR